MDILAHGQQPLDWYLDVWDVHVFLCYLINMLACRLILCIEVKQISSLMFFNIYLHLKVVYIMALASVWEYGAKSC